MELLIEILGIVLFCIVWGIIIWFIDDFHNNVNKILQMIRLVAVPNNTGVRRLCLVVAIVLCCIMAIIADWDDFLDGDMFIILYLTLVFIAPFILAKIIEYIVDGFKQGQ